MNMIIKLCDFISNYLIRLALNVRGHAHARLILVFAIMKGILFAELMELLILISVKQIVIM